jgi:RNA polymerase sigma-70 factor (ECF subfamily)
MRPTLARVETEACFFRSEVYAQNQRPPLMPPQDPETARWFAEHIQGHEPMLRAWLVRSFGPRLDVDDVVQEAFLRVLRAHGAGELQAPKAFLFATARNLALDHLRRHHVSRTDSLMEADFSNVLDDHESIPGNVARNQELALLTEAIQSLPDRCRQVMTLRIVYGLTQRIIGEKLGISDRTVAAQLAIGTKKCTDHLLRRLADRRPSR